MKPRPHATNRLIGLAPILLLLVTPARAQTPPPIVEDRLVVTVRDLGGNWSLLTSETYGFDHLLRLSMAVPDRGGGQDPSRDRVYVFAHSSTNEGDSRDVEKLALISGPWGHPWGGPGLTEVLERAP